MMKVGGMKLSTAIALLLAGVSARLLVSIYERKPERVREYVKTTSQVYETKTIQSIQIYDFRSRLSGTNVLFELAWIIYDDEMLPPLDPNKIKLLTRIVSKECKGEFREVKERRREKTGERTFKSTVVLPNVPNVRRDFTFCSEVWM